MVCDFCGSKELELLYEVPTSKNNSKIYECTHCKLVQSSYVNIKRSKEKSISCDADWGNIRHGKKIRLNSSLELISKYIHNYENFSSVLDIGSNRGHFLNFISENTSIPLLIGVEPDNSIINNYNSKISIKNMKFEDYMLMNPGKFKGGKTFDLIYCCHTLEHAKSAREMLENIKLLMNCDSYLYLEVPNIEQIEYNKFNVEEFFIDKHHFHFSYITLSNILDNLGFNFIFTQDDGYNIQIIAKLESTDIVVTKYSEVQNYINNLHNDRFKLIQVCEQLKKLSLEYNLIFYGATKIFDALVKYGNLDTSIINLLVDDYLYGYLDNAHGISVNSPLAFGNLDKDKYSVVVLAMSSASTIISKLQNENFKNIIYIGELI